MTALIDVGGPQLFVHAHHASQQAYAPPCATAATLTIFLLLMPVKEGQLTLYEGIVKALLEDKKKYWGVFVFDYDDKPCLLSDRGHRRRFCVNASSTFMPSAAPIR